MIDDMQQELLCNKMWSHFIAHNMFNAIIVWIDVFGMIDDATVRV